MTGQNDRPQRKYRPRRFVHTHSCWECRGAKVKCIFTRPDDTACERCTLRGARCVGQDQPKHPLAKIDLRKHERNRRRDNGGNRPGDNDENLNRPKHQKRVMVRLEPVEPVEPLIPQKYQVLSAGLLGVFPTQRSVEAVVRLAGLIPPFFHQMVRKPPAENFSFGEKEKQELVAELTIRHTRDTHPLVIARQMLLLAICFRYIHPSSHGSLTGFTEPPESVMQRMASAAIEVVDRNNDSMMHSLEGIECLLLASTFHADSGDLRSAWSTTRRAMLLAQLMSLHRSTKSGVALLPKSIQTLCRDEWDPQFLWYRIVFFDRFFSLVLGLPQGSTDSSCSSSSNSISSTTESESVKENDMPSLSRIQRQHSALAGRIIQRNESGLWLIINTIKH